MTAVAPDRRRRARRITVALVALTLGCGDGADAPSRDVTVPAGATFQAVVDTLAARGVIEHESLFALYARSRGADTRVRAGGYRLDPDDPWSEIVDALTEGRVLTRPVTIPEGFTLRRIAPRLADVTGQHPDTVLRRLDADSAHLRYDVPGPGLEGYLFPDTYRFAPGARLEQVVETLTEEYRSFWTPERKARLDSLGMTEREVVTLASIIQAEARRVDEMPTISSVYHNRLDRGWLLQADPTVLYALGGPRKRLLYAAIDSVADDPYNTYSQPGLPPGPIGAPGEAALEAALHPADTPYLYFVARPSGEHVFTRTLAEHNRAKARARRAWDTVDDARGLPPVPDTMSGGSQRP